MNNNGKEQFEIWIRELKAKERYLLVLDSTDTRMLRDIQKLLEQMISFAEQNDVSLSLIEFRQLYLHKANILLHFNEYAQALQEYEKAKEKIQAGEQDIELHWFKCMEGISWTKARMGCYIESLKDCNELIAYAYERNMLLPKFFIVRACCYKELGDEILAERSFDISSKPMHLNVILKEEGDESFISGYTAIGYNALGNRYFTHEIFDKALKMYENAIRLNPDYILAYYNKGVVFTQMQHHDLAIKAYSQCLKLDPKNVNAYLNRGNEYCYVTEWDSALQDYRACLSLDPGNQMAKDNMNYVRNHSF